MIVLDTNVLSEATRSAPEQRVLDWLAEQQATSLFTTTISEAEILYGVAALPAGRRRTALEDALRRMFSEDFPGRVLAFDRSAAAEFALIASARRSRGRPISAFDAQIAAIARAHGAAVATRNVSDFDGCGIDVIDPWAA
ncbi:type II toxin-antitoxin system VapC family toxin [Reyranella sp.]|uniref:type II toxin-antitoxin system VapC family toxin n=1 Tax=Reyranella sp. TaxID=1929291 RepID=UPI003BAB87F1